VLRNHITKTGHCTRYSVNWLDSTYSDYFCNIHFNI